MEPPAFSLLVAACMAALFSARFALASFVEQTITPVAAVMVEPTMALPPKPQGMDAPQPLGEGDGEGDLLLTREGCDARDGSLKDICYHILASQGAAHDPKASLVICDAIGDVELRFECHADVAEAIAPANRVAAEAICVAIPSTKWRGQCHFGMGLALAETDPLYALGRCEHAETFRDFCRHDVVGEAALVDLEPVVAFCAKEAGDTLTRKTCWHGMGKYLARRDFQEAADACARSTPEWVGNCFHGVGWGAAERDPDATLRACDRVDPYSDNCRQGVAHQLKRADPTRAVSICESIGTPTIRTRCLAFVTR